MGHRHPVNQEHHDDAPFGARLADHIANGIGSWRFIIIQTVIVIIWFTLNTLAFFVWKWDAYPFILLNLGFSLQAAYTGPILLLAGNRQAQKDRLTLEHTAAETDKLDGQNQAILLEIKSNTELTNQILASIQKTEEKIVEAVS